MTSLPPRSPIRSVRDLEVYQRSRRLMLEVHKIVVRFPDFEKFDLADQMRRASKSVPTTMAEGYALRESVKEFKRYLRVSLGSANEMEIHIENARDLGYIDRETAQRLIDEYQIVGKQLTRLIASWRAFDRPASSLQPPASARTKESRGL
jgi:four helix bundle protein